MKLINQYIFALCKFFNIYIYIYIYIWLDFPLVVGSILSYHLYLKNNNNNNNNNREMSVGIISHNNKEKINTREIP